MLLVNRGGLKIGFADAKELNTLFQTYRIASDPRRPHAVDKNLAFAEFLECPPEPADFRIYSGARERDDVARFLEAAGISKDDQIVYANPTARWETKLWNIPSWAELADLLISRAGARVIFAGGQGDLPYILQIRKLMKEQPVVAAGRLNLAEAVALMAVVDLYVGVDSGPMHIAAFSGTPVVALFGPTDPAKVGPYGDGHLVIRREDLDCLACRKRSCSDRKCLEGLSPETVFERALSMILPSRK
jgi:ADP-heptose:LPS heptosyltransferase